MLTLRQKELSFLKLEQIRMSKRKEKGGFSKRLCLIEADP